MEDELNSINEELEELVEIRSNELRRSNHLYKSIARNFPNGSIYVFDRQFNYVFADGQELKKRGLSGDELVGKNYSEMMNESIREKVIPSLKRTFLGEEVKFEILYLNSCFFLHAVPLKNGNPDGEIDRILVVERDVSEEKRIEKEIKESLERERELNNLKSRFVTIVSHEFRTPLSAIKSSSELIERYPEGEQQDKRLKHTKRIQSSVNHLNGMIEDILSLSKIEEGKVEFKITDFNLDDVIENIITEHLEVYPKQAIEFEKGEHLISSDRKLVSHIIQNLVSNAFKYSKDDELVSVKVKEEGDGYCVCVKDRGIGIPEADQQKLFERFYRATNVANIKGTGLGLNIVVKYLEHLNGKIRFTSQENQGTEFIVHLPKTRKV
jgi:signal transduction histidine kinase